MKLGEIKLQAIRIGFPDFFISCDETDDESLINAVAALKQDSNFSGFLESIVGSVNRACAYIESKGLCETECVDISFDKITKGQGGEALIAVPSNALSVKRVILNKDYKVESLNFRVEDGKIVTEYREGIYRIIYKRKIPRVSSVTSDAYTLEAPFGLVEYIPYFVASDILSREREDYSELREYFEQMVENALGNENTCNSCFETRYCME